MGNLTTNSPAGLLQAYAVRWFSDKGQSAALNGWTWVIGKIPLGPDQVIVFIDQGGVSGLPHLLVDYLGLQVIVRSSKGDVGYNSSYLMMRMIRDALLGPLGQPPEFTELTGITERGTIVPMGYDESDRHRWSCNFNLLVEPAVTPLSHRVSL